MTTDQAVGVLDAQIEESLRPKRPLYVTVWNLARQNPLGVFGLVVVIGLVIVAVFAPLIAPYDVGTLQTSAQVKADPSWSSLFGTDHLGRDMFSRVVFGTRISLMVGLIAVGGGTAIALVLGIISGYAGGVVDNIIQRAVDTFIAFPGLLLALLVLTTLGARDAPWDWLDDYWEAVLIVLTIGVIFMPGISRVMRSVTLHAKNQEYVMSARLRGESAAFSITACTALKGYPTGPRRLDPAVSCLL